MNRIATGCKSIDGLLGGGIESGSVTMFYGEGGCGKTNICLQVAYNVVNAGRKVAYIDTEGLSMDRVDQIFGENNPLFRDVLVFHVHSFEEQSDAVDKIQKLSERNLIGLAVVDSMTMFYRLNHDDNAVRNDFVRQTEVLLDLARRFEIPVLLTSQVYTNITTGSIEFLGGHAMMHNAKTIIRLDKKNEGVRVAVIIKHRSLPEGKRATYRITATGISDL